MYTLNLPWTSFKISLPDLENWLKANSGSFYLGNSADSKLSLYFSQEPSQQIKDSIAQHMNSLSADSEAAKIAHFVNLDKAVAQATANLPYASFDSLIVPEKKIWMSQPLSLADKELLLVKFPQG